MAEILYSIRDPGDIVSVKPDGFTWPEHLMGRIVKMPKLSLADARKYKEYDYSMVVQADLVNDPTLQKENILEKDIIKIQVKQADLSAIDLVAKDSTYTVLTRAQRESEQENVKLLAVTDSKTVEVTQKQTPTWYGTGKRFKVNEKAKTIIDKVDDSVVYAEPK